MPRNKKKLKDIARSAKGLDDQLPLMTNYDYVCWLAGLSLLGLVIVILSYLRNQSSTALAYYGAEAARIDTPSNFFRSADVSDSFGAQDSFINSIKFDWHDHFNVKNPKLYAENMRVLNEEIKLQKELLTSLPLSHANQAALSETTIRLMPAYLTPSGGVSYESGNLFFGMIDYVTPSERRQALVNEIHHVTVGYINKHKLSDNVKVSGKQLYFPFLNEQGKIDAQLKVQLKSAFNQIEQRINRFDTLLQTSSGNDQLNLYLEAVTDYQPQVLRYELSNAEFANRLKNQSIRTTKDGKLILTLPDGNPAYGRIHGEGNKINILYSLNKDMTREELAKAFIQDYRHKLNILKNVYPVEYAKRGEKFGENDFLKELASDIDELMTPEMKRKFGPLFESYFDAYNELDIAIEPEAVNFYQNL